MLCPFSNCVMAEGVTPTSAPSRVRGRAARRRARVRRAGSKSSATPAARRCAARLRASCSSTGAFTLRTAACGRPDRHGERVRRRARPACRSRESAEVACRRRGGCRRSCPGCRRAGRRRTRPARPDGETQPSAGPEVVETLPDQMQVAQRGGVGRLPGQRSERFEKRALDGQVGLAVGLRGGGPYLTLSPVHAADVPRTRSRADLADVQDAPGVVHLQCPRIPRADAVDAPTRTCDTAEHLAAAPPGDEDAGGRAAVRADPRGSVMPPANAARRRRHVWGSG